MQQRLIWMCGLALLAAGCGDDAGNDDAGEDSAADATDGSTGDMSGSVGTAPTTSTSDGTDSTSGSETGTTDETDSTSEGETESTGETGGTVDPAGWCVLLQGAVTKSASENAVFRVCNDGEPELLVDSSGVPIPSPDGTKFAHVEGSDLWVYDFAKGSDVMVSEVPLDPMTQTWWAPSGEALGYDIPGKQRSELYVVRADGSDHMQATDELFGLSSASVVWAEEGTTVSYVTNGLDAGARPKVWVIEFPTDGPPAPVEVDALPGIDERAAVNFRPFGDGFVGMISDGLSEENIYRLSPDGSAEQITDDNLGGDPIGGVASLGTVVMNRISTLWGAMVDGSLEEFVVGSEVDPVIGLGIFAINDDAGQPQDAVAVYRRNGGIVVTRVAPRETPVTVITPPLSVSVPVDVKPQGIVAVKEEPLSQLVFAPLDPPEEESTLAENLGAIQNAVIIDAARRGSDLYAVDLGAALVLFLSTEEEAAKLSGVRSNGQDEGVLIPEENNPSNCQDGGGFAACVTDTNGQPGLGVVSNIYDEDGAATTPEVELVQFTGQGLFSIWPVAPAM